MVKHSIPVINPFPFPTLRKKKKIHSRLLKWFHLSPHWNNRQPPMQKQAVHVKTQSPALPSLLSYYNCIILIWLPSVNKHYVLIKYHLRRLISRINSIDLLLHRKSINQYWEGDWYVIRFFIFQIPYFSVHYILFLPCIYCVYLYLFFHLQNQQRKGLGGIFILWGTYRMRRMEGVGSI